MTVVTGKDSHGHDPDARHRRGPCGERVRSLAPRAEEQQTRQALRREALRLFGERGFDATTIHDITEAADVAPRTFFLHFGSKEDVLLGDARDGVAAFEEMLRDRPDDEDVFTAVRETVIGLLALDDTPVEETRLQARLMIDAPSLMGRVYEHYVEFEEIIARAVADRLGSMPSATPTRGCSRPVP